MLGIPKLKHFLQFKFLIPSNFSPGKFSKFAATVKTDTIHQNVLNG